jgi:hypothetical protein
MINRDIVFDEMSILKAFMEDEKKEVTIRNHLY